MVNTKVAVPKVSSARETSSPMRSSDLRQKMRSETAVHTAAKMTSIATAYTAKESGERPRPSSARRPEGESCPVGQVTVGQGTCNSANSAGMPTTKRPTASAATRIHATLASSSRRPLSRTRSESSAPREAQT
jgi:hypothetical protein